MTDDQWARYTLKATPCQSLFGGSCTKSIEDYGLTHSLGRSAAQSSADRSLDRSITGRQVSSKSTESLGHMSAATQEIQEP